MNGWSLVTWVPILLSLHPTPKSFLKRAQGWIVTRPAVHPGQPWGSRCRTENGRFCLSPFSKHSSRELLSEYWTEVDGARLTPEPAPYMQLSLARLQPLNS